MNDLVKKLMSQANLDEKAADKALAVVKDFLEEKLPEPISGQVMKLLDGLDIEDSGDVLGKIKGLF